MVNFIEQARTAILALSAGGAWLLNLPPPRHAAVEWNNLHFVWMCLLCVTQRTSTLHLRCTSTAPPLHPTCTSPCCIVIILLELHSQLTDNEVRFNCKQPTTHTHALAHQSAMHTRETHIIHQHTRIELLVPLLCEREFNPTCYLQFASIDVH
jgi:hypothetical protein